ncbi:hypothetical protein E2562_019746 [Oryza meyeriana var. granulata]|uniref:Uncharacterized protein n=1 Tax=Oryza meyeriana var. granulata TaxID=110450 RepID=A0A6G1C8Z7_9ORYZ|nr:hypothetical protein E2562_019746 [Oryza meyeriana var. granulata]
MELYKELIRKVAEGVQTVHRNGDECRQLAGRADRLAGELQKLQESEMEGRLGEWESLEGLNETLRRAYELVAACQKGRGFGTYVRCFCLCYDLADELRAVRQELAWVHSLTNYNGKRIPLRDLSQLRHHYFDVIPNDAIVNSLNIRFT